jgi:uncharacterized protein (TIGR00375 family)
MGSFLYKYTLRKSMIYADLHIHSKYSQGTSKNLDLESLEKWARIKGINLLGTGDFTHPKWVDELKSKLKKKDNSGVYYTKDNFPFLLQTEISLVFTQGGRGRRVHVIVLAPNLEIVEKITNYLLTKGRIDYDGRPIFKISCRDFVFDLRKISEDIEVIPAHIWTPWFAVFGSKSGFDSLKEAFGDQVKYINAIETGLSSDPPMNWRVKELDGYQLVSFSDLHSFWPWRLGRELTIFDTEYDYYQILKAIRTGKGLKGTVEVNPNYGKYHFDGHRKCDVCLHPSQTIKLKGICPKCNKPLVVGVQNRVEELAQRKQGYKPKNPKDFYTLIPLSELIAKFLNAGIQTQKVWEIYYKIIQEFGNEMEILLNVNEINLRKFIDKDLVDLIILNRKGKIDMTPGYDGVYGDFNI